MLGFQSNTMPSSHERHALGVTPTFALAHDYMADTTYGPTLRNEQVSAASFWGWGGVGGEKGRSGILN